MYKYVKLCHTALSSAMRKLYTNYMAACYFPIELHWQISLSSCSVQTLLLQCIFKWPIDTRVYRSITYECACMWYYIVLHYYVSQFLLILKQFPLEFLGSKTRPYPIVKRCQKEYTNQNTKAYTLLPSSKNFLVPQPSVCLWGEGKKKKVFFVVLAFRSLFRIDYYRIFPRALFTMILNDSSFGTPSLKYLL